MNIPDPKSYQDGIQFLRDVHKVILANCDSLLTLLTDAEQQGVFPSFESHKEWGDVLNFFSRYAPQHEREEEELLFPRLQKKLPRMGFQSPDAPIRFLVEGHEVLQSRMQPMIAVWSAYRAKHRDREELAKSAVVHSAEDKQFILSARELVDMYRHHVATEEEKVYREADRLFSPREKMELVSQLQSRYDNEAITPPPVWDAPHFSNPGYQVKFVTDAQGSVMDADFEEDES